MCPRWLSWVQFWIIFIFAMAAFALNFSGNIKVVIALCGVVVSKLIREIYEKKIIRRYTKKEMVGR